MISVDVNGARLSVSWSGLFPAERTTGRGHCVGALSFS